MAPHLAWGRSSRSAETMPPWQSAELLKIGSEIGECPSDRGRRREASGARRWEERTGHQDNGKGVPGPAPVEQARCGVEACRR